MSDDPHDADVLALVERLMALEYERGQLRERLALHLRIRDMAAGPVASVATVTPIRTGRRAAGELQQVLIDALKAGPLTASDLAQRTATALPTVRVALRRLVDRDTLELTGHHYALKG